MNEKTKTKLLITHTQWNEIKFIRFSVQQQQKKRKKDIFCEMHHPNEIEIERRERRENRWIFRLFIYSYTKIIIIIIIIFGFGRLVSFNFPICNLVNLFIYSFHFCLIEILDNQPTNQTNKLGKKPRVI